MKKKTLWVLVAIIVIILAIVFSKNSNNSSNGKTVIGAILPMTGPSAVYGENLKLGMEYALKDFDPEGNFALKIEDSQGLAPSGVSAFNKLLNDNVDVFVSALSRVSVPLKDLAKQNKKPLVMTLVSAMSAVNDDNPYVYRIFHNAETLSVAHTKTIETKGYKNVAIVYVNDEFGSSVNEILSGMLKSKGVAVSSEAYGIDQSDYRTQIGKIKSAKPDAVVFVGIPPTSIQNFIKQKAELGLSIPLLDGAGVLPGAGVIKMIGPATEGVYSFAASFDLGKTGDSIRSDLAKRGVEPTYAVAYAYDTVKYIIEAKKKAIADKSSLTDAMASLNSFEGLQGNYLLTGKYKQEIQPTTVVPVQVAGGKLVEVK